MKFTKKFYFAAVSFVVLLLQALGLKFDFPMINEIIASAAAILVMLGIITDSHPSAEDNGDTDIKEDISKDNDNDEAP